MQASGEGKRQPAAAGRTPKRLLFQALDTTRRPATLFMIIQEFIEEGKPLPDLSVIPPRRVSLQQAVH